MSARAAAAGVVLASLAIGASSVAVEVPGR